MTVLTPYVHVMIVTHHVTDLAKKGMYDCLHFCYLFTYFHNNFSHFFSVWILVFQKPPLQILHFLIFLITWAYQRYFVVHQKMWRKIRVQRKYNNLSISHKKCSFNMKCPKISKKYFWAGNDNLSSYRGRRCYVPICSWLAHSQCTQKIEILQKFQYHNKK